MIFQRQKLFLIVALTGALLSANAEILDRPGGIKIGQRMTLRPYVSFSASYDSNVGSRNNDAEGDLMWTISPTLGLSYNAETWSLLLNGYYNYNAYAKGSNNEHNQHSYGQDLRWNWESSGGDEKGWSLVLGETFRQITMADDMTLADGRGYTADSRQIQLSGALQRRFGNNWHGDINGSYYWLDYMNDTTQYNSFYGWQRWTVGAEVGYAASRWTDILISGAYQGFQQDNAQASEIGDGSQGYTLQVGLGSFMTERISYRALAGWSRFEYGDSSSSSDGFVYTISGNWKIGETWNTMLLATSYYTPSERQSNSQSRNDAVSWGLAKTMIQNKLRATLDLQYRHETIEHAVSSGYDYGLDIVTGRIGFSYSLNRFLSLFVNGEYQRSFNDESDSRNGAYDYDRWRITGGFTVSY